MQQRQKLQTGGTKVIPPPKSLWELAFECNIVIVGVSDLIQNSHRHNCQIAEAKKGSLKQIPAAQQNVTNKLTWSMGPDWNRQKIWVHVCQLYQIYESEMQELILL